VITLYRARFSTNVERVALALALKGLEVESVWITYEDRSVVERVSGQPLVPVLDYDGQIVVESMDIVHFLEERHPEPALYPEDPSDVLAFIDWFNNTWKGPPNQIEAELGNPQPDRALISRLEQEMLHSLDLFEAALGIRDYLFGDTLTAATSARSRSSSTPRCRTPRTTSSSTSSCMTGSATAATGPRSPHGSIG
jgi:glutathione S-transferase